MTTHKTKILEMLQSGKISIEEAEKLLKAVDPEPKVSATVSKANPKFLNILVNSKEENGKKIKIKIPFRLLRAGMKLTSLIPQDSRAKIQEAIDRKGINFDLSQLNDLNMEELIETLTEFEVAIDDYETVQIFCS